MQGRANDTGQSHSAFENPPQGRRTLGLDDPASDLPNHGVQPAVHLDGYEIALTWISYKHLARPNLVHEVTPAHRFALERQSALTI